jgi:hypothetical protein
MYSLPYITLPMELLLPHPGGTYSLGFKKDFIKTAHISSPGVINDKAFVIIIAKGKLDFAPFGVLSVLNNKKRTRFENHYTFTAIEKVEIVDVDAGLDGNELIHFELQTREKPTKSDKDNYNAIVRFIKNTESLNRLQEDVNLGSTEVLKTLNQIIKYLNPTLKQEYSFFETAEIKDKLTLINLLLINDLSSHVNDVVTSKSYPKLVIKKIKKEHQRLLDIPKASNEYSATLDYLELIQALPWKQQSLPKIDLNDLQQKLDSEHHGLQEVKNSLIDHFAFESLTGRLAGNIILFDGPPGTGKTSIARTLAYATGRELVSIALGGVSDESEIRGHRRTYVGARPGRIIAEMKNTGSTNPIILLDEIDKIGSSNRGSVEAAFLELLDSEQNNKFVDRFLEIPYDFSNAFFICTSNEKRNISKPLLDRLDVITFKSYTVAEKQQILSRYIIPSLFKKYELLDYSIVFEEEFLLELAEGNDLRALKKITFRCLKHAAKELIINKNKEVRISSKTYHALCINNNLKRIGF